MYYFSGLNLVTWVYNKQNKAKRGFHKGEN
jgi:hypothetical protein